MQAQNQRLLSRYRYDPLDRLSACTVAAQGNTQWFYTRDRLATEIEAAMQRSIVQHKDHLLAQHVRLNNTVGTFLLATDLQRSVLNLLDAERRANPFAYSPYGYRPLEGGLLSLLGFNGERPDPVTGHYVLGNGYRAFNPVLMRFNSPDSWSPFGKGGVNAYAYCGGDPFNRGDETGHAWWIFRPVVKLFRTIFQSKKTTNPVSKPSHDASIQTAKPLPKQPTQLPSTNESGSAPDFSSFFPSQAPGTKGFTALSRINKSSLLVFNGDNYVGSYPIDRKSMLIARLAVTAETDIAITPMQKSEVIRKTLGLGVRNEGSMYILPERP
ncbi:RHS repeat-associated core domain-containing protein [Pseudomonas sp. RIT-PI-q]|uniref:RHS repeat-associated core domain-containing protein n=1 Tax=Pseudomonas sp. RIT-PI-q TaxID=1690247 RepID=UPI0009EC78D8|nr:RHS repeat-associated core domain-containing protein [Pseudomonas sp. RIT-PI-q]